MSAAVNDVRSIILAVCEMNDSGRLELSDGRNHRLSIPNVERTR
jgi:hypothetical protein